MDAKTKAIVAHITLIGWVIALVMNNSNKEELTSFYIRQMLGLMIIGLASVIVGKVPIIGGIISMVISIGSIILWILSLIGAASGEERPLPIVGEYFQNMFSSL